MREVAGKLFSNFLLIYLFLTADMAVLSGLGINPEISVGFGWEINMLARSVFLTLPGLIFNSKRELSVWETVVRRVLHFCTIELIVLFNVYFLDGVRTPKALIIVAISIFIAYMLVFLGECFLSFSEAEKMNRMLAEIKKKSD